MITEKTGSRFLLLYGSETGQSEAIAEELKAKAESVGMLVDLHCLNEIDRKFSIEKESCVIVITATTGDGEPPENALKFIRRLRKRTLPKDYLSAVRYALLALGDSNYMSFCNFGKCVDKRFLELGATHFHPTSYADDSVGLEITVEPWLDEIVHAVAKELSFKSVKLEESWKAYEMLNAESHDRGSADGTKSTLLASEKLGSIDVTLPTLASLHLKCDFDEDKVLVLREIPKQNNCAFPSQASETIREGKITQCRKLTDSNSVKEVIELTVESGEVIDYVPGDSFGFLCQNSDDEVSELLSRLGVQDKASVPCSLTVTVGNKKLPPHLPPLATLSYFLGTCCEIRSIPKKAFLRVLAEHTLNETEKRRLLELSSRQGAQEYTSIICEKQLNLLDILRAFPTCRPPVEVLLQHLPRLQPRFYSVACSPLENLRRFTVCLSIVTFAEIENERRARCGVCSGWLQRTTRGLSKSSNTESLADEIGKLSINETGDILSQPLVYFYRRNNASFKLPNDVSVPIVLIGPGTGVAPFIGFLQHIERLRNQACAPKRGDVWLFFGCRYRKLDFLYESELHRLSDEKIITKLFLAFSREADSEAKYVQDNIRTNGKDLINLVVKKGAKIYVCGDAKGMAKDVSSAIQDCYKTANNCSESEALVWLTSLQDQKRYIQDIWL